MERGRLLELPLALGSGQVNHGQVWSQVSKEIVIDSRKSAMRSSTSGGGKGKVAREG